MTGPISLIKDHIGGMKYQVGELFGQSLHVLRHHQDVIVGPVESHGTGDPVVAVQGRAAGVPPGHVQAGAAPVVASPEAEPDRGVHSRYEIEMSLRLLSYSIKPQLKAPKAPY